MGEWDDFNPIQHFDKIFDPKDPAPVSVPGLSDKEQQLIDLQIEAIKAAMEPSEEQTKLAEQQQKYFETLTANQTLSEDELAEFEREYNLQLSALQDQYQLKLDEDSSSLYADLVSRGVDTTTTGRNLQTKLAKGYGEALQGSIAELGQAQETAKYDMEQAKREMALQGYKLTSDIQQFNLNNSLAMAQNTQNYLATNRAMSASAALQNAILTQQVQQEAYRNRQGMWRMGYSFGGSMATSGGGGGGG